MISVDPGVNGSGIACWDGKRLEMVTYGTSYFCGVQEDVVIELPQIYPGIKSKGNPNDLIKLAFAAGQLVGCLQNIKVVKPREWKGTIKKEAMLKRILSKLTDAELKLLKDLQLPKSVEHNVVDAIGIGLWHLGRL